MTTSSTTTVDAIGATTTAVASGVTDARSGRATRDIVKYVMIVAQLALVLFVFRGLRLEEPAFLRLAGIAFTGFAIHYWLPFRWKEAFCIAVSLAGAFVLLNVVPALLVIGVGLVIYGIVASPMTYRVRLGMILMLVAILVYGRATGGFGVPYQVWPVLGAIFAFRLIIYLYDLRHSKGTPSIREFLSYFFILPNYYFLLFPVIDFQTMRRSYFQRDIHLVAQQGVDWIVRGIVQLILYRLVYHFKGPSNSPADITSVVGLLSAMTTTYLLYLRVSGQFHIIIGLLHLFGYDLPETHRRYLLARSLTDFWRRINIYWKDFMVKIVYFPVYFRLRRSGDMRARILATAAVFFVTWMLHSYQWFWLRGEVLLTWPDAMFWGILGIFVIVNLLIEQRQMTAGRRRRVIGPVRNAIQTAGTFLLISTLWSLWNAPSVGDWMDVLTWWEIG